METTATQAAFYLPLVKWTIISFLSLTGIVATAALVYAIALFHPYAKDR